ncbi:hypothetical protein [Mycolicibacterium palauense]|uniref:hypothetical protein n=1 Tax=Mycolicibacterium palauense TaxID=2034511 RepID=UPI000BFF06E1|nr:hypothetical protein [Mycolicibacterium palauense]
MKLKRIAGASTVAAALGAALLGLGVGTAQADDHLPWDPWGPGSHWVDAKPAPGQVQKLCPWQSPPGHWIGGPHGIPCT